MCLFLTPSSATDSRVVRDLCCITQLEVPRLESASDIRTKRLSMWEGIAFNLLFIRKNLLFPLGAREKCEKSVVRWRVNISSLSAITWLLDAVYMAGIRSIAICDKPVIGFFGEMWAVKIENRELFFFCLSARTILLARLWSTVECGSAFELLISLSKNCLSCVYDFF